LQRDYPKGRDWFDLYWYLNQPHWPPPNIAMLQQALLQSGWQGGKVTESNWQVHVQQRLETLNWGALVDDVRRFVMAQQLLEAFKKETVEGLLRRL
jgi:hypothetical protein